MARSLSELLGSASGGSSGIGAPPAAFRAQPSVAPVPNAVPAGAQTGAPPRVSFFGRLVAPSSTRKPTLIAPGTPENRVLTVTTPSVPFTIYLGGPDVTPNNGMPLPQGQTIEIPIVGLQEIWAITDAPTYQKIGGLISIVLMAEQARPVGRISNG
jgi:hypothetical protein